MNNKVLEELIKFYLQENSNIFNSKNKKFSIGLFDKQVSTNDLQKIEVQSLEVKREISNYINSNLIPFLNKILSHQKEINKLSHSFNQGQIVIDPNKKGYIINRDTEGNQETEHFIGTDKELLTKIYRIFLQECLEYIRFIDLYINTYDNIIQYATDIKIKKQFVNMIAKEIENFKKEVKQKVYIDLKKNLSELKVRNPNFLSDEFTLNITNIEKNQEVLNRINALIEDFEFKTQNIVKKVYIVSSQESLIREGIIDSFKIGINIQMQTYLYVYLLSGFGDFKQGIEYEYTGFEYDLENKIRAILITSPV